MYGCVCRALRQLAELDTATKEDRQKAMEAAAENRILIATLRSMQDECHACKVRAMFSRPAVALRW